MTAERYEKKEAAIALRQTGRSLKTIHRALGVPLSTLSGWLKDVELDDDQKQQLHLGQRSALEAARRKAADWHRTQKTLHQIQAKQAAAASLSNIDVTDEILDLAFAMLCFSQKIENGARQTSTASSDPKTLQFALAILKRNYDVKPENIRCDLHIRADQNADSLKTYWSKTLGIPIGQFKYIAIDQRSAGKTTYDHYKGVCVLHWGKVAIQRKMVYLYNLFCEKIIQSGT